jgi:hypothetical protein
MNEPLTEDELQVAYDLWAARLNQQAGAVRDRVLACCSQIVGTRLDITPLPRWRSGLGVHQPGTDGTRTVGPPKRTIGQLMVKYNHPRKFPSERLTEAPVACEVPGCRALTLDRYCERHAEQRRHAQENRQERLK